MIGVSFELVPAQIRAAMEPSSPRNMADPNGRNSGYETDLYTRLLSDGADQDDGELSDDPANDIMVQVVPSSSSYSPRQVCHDALPRVNSKALG